MAAPLKYRLGEMIKNSDGLQTVEIIIDEGKFKDLSFQFGEVYIPKGIPEESSEELCSVTVHYDIINLPEHLNTSTDSKLNIEKSEEFCKIITDFIEHFLEQYIERQTNKNGVQ